MALASYGDKLDSYFEDPRSEMGAYVPTNTHNLLEVGCGTAAFAAGLKASRSLRVTVIEPFAAAAEIAARRVDEVISQPIEQAVASLRGRQFDCIVLNDVLEHLVDPWQSLVELRSLVSPGGCLVASIPNIRYLPVFKDLVLNANWTYRKTGVLDQTHLRFFTHRSLHGLFNSSGYQIDRIEGINPVDVSWRFKLVNALVGQRLDDTRFKQFACVVRPA